MPVLTAPIDGSPASYLGNTSAIELRYNTNSANVYQLYSDFYAVFTHEPNYKSRPTLTLNNKYIMPSTNGDITALNTNCSTLYDVATNFKRDVWYNKNTTTYTANLRAATIGGIVNTGGSFTDGIQYTTGPTNITSQGKATNLIDGYKQIVYMTDLLIRDLWAFMKNPITDGTNSVMATEGNPPTNSSLAQGLTSQINTDNIIQIVNDGSNNYNLGFNHDDQNKNILKKQQYKDFKSYVFFARDLLTLLSTEPNFMFYNNTGSPSLGEILNKGIAALTSAIAALETPCDTRWKVGGKYMDSNTGLYATRNNMDSDLNQLYQLPGSAIYTSKTNYTATMVAGTIWTAFASALVYYIFTEL